MRIFILAVGGLVCITVAVSAFAIMFTTFAPANPSQGWMPGELEAIERVRNYFWPTVNFAAGLLLACGVWLLVSAAKCFSNSTTTG